MNSMLSYDQISGLWDLLILPALHSLFAYFLAGFIFGFGNSSNALKKRMPQNFWDGGKPQNGIYQILLLFGIIMILYSFSILLSTIGSWLPFNLKSKQSVVTLYMCDEETLVSIWSQHPEITFDKLVQIIVHKASMLSSENSYYSQLIHKTNNDIQAIARMHITSKAFFALIFVMDLLLIVNIFVSSMRVKFPKKKILAQLRIWNISGAIAKKSLGRSILALFLLAAVFFYSIYQAEELVKRRAYLRALLYCVSIESEPDYKIDRDSQRKATILLKKLKESNDSSKMFTILNMPTYTSAYHDD